MESYRITRLWIEGMRTLDRVELDLSAGGGSGEPAVPTVLIGPNGSGKSTIIEACELLRKAATERQFISKLFDVHGGPPSLLRRGSTQLVLGVECSAGGHSPVRYELTLRSTGSSLLIAREEVRVLGAGSDELLLEREGHLYRDFSRKRARPDSEIAADQPALAVLSGLGEVPAFSLSDGQLSYLALVGILRLHRSTPPALVAFDEPDLHLHPGLARRLMTDIEVFARKRAVLVATQSDAMLDVLSEPARSTVLCELDERHATQLRRPDEDTLRKWLEDYRGLGELRAAGYEGVVFPAFETP